MVHRKFQPVFVLIVIVLFFVQGCAGRAAHPVQVAQSGDNEKTCKSLRKETKKIRPKLKKMIPLRTIQRSHIKKILQSRMRRKLKRGIWMLRKSAEQNIANIKCLL